jgi:glycolate oxidase FAD binding subunit
VLSTERVCGVDDFDPAEGVCHARAGTPLADAREQVARGGWELPLDAPGPGATVGGALAAAAIGPRAQGFGPPRDQVLGLEIALASGERVRCGGRVVKNVTGYDLGRLYTGSLGTLGVITGAWLRLRPLPERSAVLEADRPEAEAACRAGLLAGRRGSSRASAVLSAAGDGPRRYRVVFELAGPAAAVERDAAWARDELGAREAAPGALDAVREAQAATPGGAGLRFRIACLPSALPACARRLAEGAATLLAYPAAGLVYAGFPWVEGARASSLDALFAAVARGARDAGGHWICESAPTPAKLGRDVFGESAPALRLFRALKDRFDPGRVLNPGRFAGGI